MARKPRPTHTLLTVDIDRAFRAAVAMWGEEWDGPKGPAVVTDVYATKGGGWAIEYRLIRQWGKEAWQ